MKKDIFSTPFEDAYKDFQASKLSAKLADKFSPKPYFKKFHKLKLFTNVGSILFASCSAITAFSFVFLLCKSVLGLYVAAIVAVIGLTTLEIAKRLIIEPTILDYLKFKKIRVVLVLVALGLSSGSIYSSFQGSKLAINELNNHIPLIDIDSLDNANRSQTDAIEAKIEDYKTNKQYQNDKGIVFYNISAKLIPTLEKERLFFLNKISTLRDTARAENKARGSIQRATNNRAGVQLGYLTILFEFLLLVCLVFSNYYDYRSFVEMQGVYTKSDSVYTNDVEELATRKIDADIATYKNKLKNGVGKKETSQKRIKELKKKKVKINGSKVT